MMGLQYTRTPLQMSVNQKRWLRNDPLRAKYWAAGCPNQEPDHDIHWLDFRLVRPGSATVKEVVCRDCGFTDTGDAQGD